MSKVTVVIPSYNHAHYIGQAIESVLQQTHEDIELIVIDDGSSDNSIAVIEEKLQVSKKPFTLIQKTNKGLIDSLHLGLEKAQGDYFCQLASDDFLAKNSIAERVQFLQNNPNHSAVFSNGYTVIETTITEELFFSESHQKIFTIADPIPLMLKGKLPVFATGLFPTNTLRVAGGFDKDIFRFYEDLDTPIRLALQGPLGYINQPLFFRREHSSNVSRFTKHIRHEKVKSYEKLLTTQGMQPYKRLLIQRIIRSQIALGRHVKQKTTPSHEEKTTLKKAWKYAWRNPKLLIILLQSIRKMHE